jgi:hypothetical protein
VKQQAFSFELEPIAAQGITPAAEDAADLVVLPGLLEEPAEPLATSEVEPQVYITEEELDFIFGPRKQEA